MANHAHPPKGSMSRGHGIISKDIIPAPVHCQTKEDILFGEPCACPAGNNTGESNDHCIKLLKHGIISLISISSVGHYSIFRTRIILRRKEVYFA